ncbi:MAG: TetR/AcrR family transcriptional regulator [Chloroflexota bacterium]
MSHVQVQPHNILDTADALFEAQGYDNTTLRDIAQQVDIPLELLERDYACKDEIALAIYQQLSEQSHELAQTIASAPISEMYYTVLEQRLSLLTDHSEVSSILFANAMRPQARITASDIAPGSRDPIMQIMHCIVDKASDKPKRGAEDLTLFLYAFHFLVVVFWLYDRTDNKTASHMFTSFLRDLLKTLQPMLVLPLLRKALTNMAKIMMVIVGGARLVDKPKKS